jgi:signal transduction histidine kinase
VWPDGVLVVACTLVQVASLQPGNPAPPGALAGAGALVAALAGGLLLVRRRAPLAVLAGVTTAYAVQAAAVGPIVPATVAAACYTAARYGPLIRGPVVGLLAVAAVAVTVVLVAPPALAATYAVPLLLAVLAGVLVVARRARLDASTRSAVLDERLRIARDLHDVVGHGVGAITIQAGAGRMALAAGADAQVRGALLTIEQAGRDVLREVRWLVGVLREQSAVVTVRDFSALADAARSAGYTVDLSVDAELDSVSPEIVQIAYRIVQEGLTNAFRHSGSTQAQVRVQVSDAVVVTVADCGAGRAATEGNGIRGMRERATAVGGTLCAGPRHDGPGWQVDATLPIHRREAGHRFVLSPARRGSRPGG